MSRYTIVGLATTVKVTLPTMPYDNWHSSCTDFPRKDVNRRGIEMTIEEEELYRAYVTQLRGEHQQVKQCLKRIDQQLQHCCEGSDSATGVDELIHSLADLRAELAHHFAEERAGGCLEEAVIHSPCLGREAAELEREDVKLLGLLDRLIGRLQAAPSVIGGVAKEYRRLVQRISEYEAAESRIVGDSFGMGVD